MKSLSVLADVLHNASEFIESVDDFTKATIAVVFLVALVAIAFFGRNSGAKEKLIAFVCLIGLSVVGLIGLHLDASRKLKSTAPDHEASDDHATGLSGRLALMGVVHAQDKGGWIYCGTCNSERRLWNPSRGNVRFIGGSENGLPKKNDKIQTTSTVPLYDDRPKYTIYGLQWKLGRKIRTVDAGTEFRLLEEPLLLGDNVWCKVREQ